MDSIEKNGKLFSKKASDKASWFMRSCKDKAISLKVEANKAADQGNQMKDHWVTQMKTKASSMSSTKGASPPKLPKGQARHGTDAGVSAEEIEKMTSLCALGFSPAAVRHALRRCGGSVDRAAVWLLDEGSSDERLAAEMEATQTGPLGPGSLARVSGLRGAMQLNGMPVVLQGWDVESQRWLVKMPDGSAKSIRERNLDRLDDQAAALAAAEMENAPLSTGRDEKLSQVQADCPHCKTRIQCALTPGDKPVTVRCGRCSGQFEVARGKETGGNDARLQEGLLRQQVREMLGIEDGSEAAMTLDALSVDELMEVVDSLAGEAPVARAAPSAAKPAQEQQFSSCCAAADPAEVAADRARMAAEAAVSASSAIAAAPPSLSRSATSSAATAASPLEAAATCLHSGLQAAGDVQTQPEQLAARAREAKQQEAELAELEQRLTESAERMAAQEARQRLQQEAIEAREAELIQSHAQHGAASQIVDEARAAGAAEELRKQHEELKKQQEATRLAAEDRELRMLEEEAQQMRLGTSLREEQERLAQQRHSILLLQQSLLAGAGTESACIELSLDDSACTAVEEAAPEALDLSADAEIAADGQAAVIFKPPRRSLTSRRSLTGLRPILEGDGEAMASTPAAASSAESPGRPEEESDSADESDTTEEVWDLDWSQVSTKLLRQDPVAAQPSGSQSSSAPLGFDDATAEADATQTSSSGGPDAPAEPSPSGTEPSSSTSVATETAASSVPAEAAALQAFLLPGEPNIARAPLATGSPPEHCSAGELTASETATSMLLSGSSGSVSIEAVDIALAAERATSDHDAADLALSVVVGMPEALAAGEATASDDVPESPDTSEAFPKQVMKDELEARRQLVEAKSPSDGLGGSPVAQHTDQGVVDVGVEPANQQ